MYEELKAIILGETDEICNFNAMFARLAEAEAKELITNKQHNELFILLFQEEDE